MTTSRTSLWTGRIISALVIAFMVFDSAGKLLVIDPVVKAMVGLQWPAHQTQLLGLTLLTCTAVYAFPRTAVIGAILLTAYLGGATAAQARLDQPALLFSVVMGVLAWLGLYLRDPRIRELVRFSDRRVDSSTGRLSSR